MKKGPLGCLLMVVVAGVVLLPLSVTQAAQELVREVTFKIEPQALDTALLEFSKQANVQLMLAAKAVRERHSEGLSGRLSVEDGLTSLLRGTGLRFRAVGNRVTIEMPEQVSASTGEPEDRLARLEAPSPSRGEGEGRKEGADASASLEPDKSKVEEIIVTAQKRQELLKDVPISISVLRGEDLDRSTVQGISQALSRVPGVATTLGFQNGGTHVVIRGASNGGSLFGGSSTVGYYIDSVPFGLVRTPIAPDANVYDLQRVEVLRGPQGTLYGANAQSGVVRILTNDANPDAFEFKARTSGSKTENGGEGFRGDMALNVPIVEGKLAVRAVAGYDELGGWIDRPNNEDANDVEQRNLRLKINARPTENLSLGASAWFSRADYGAPATSDDNGRHTSLIDEPMSTDYAAYGLKVDYDFGGFSVSSMTSYLDYENGGLLDNTPAGFPASATTALDADVLSEELIVNSAAGSSWRWTTGLFYRDGEDRLRQFGSALPVPLDVSYYSESYAVFGQVGRRFFDERFEWTLGLRYFHDDFSMNENFNQGAPGSQAIHTEDSFSSTTPHAVLTWHPNQEVSVYASYSQGFRSGFTQNPPIIRGFPGIPAAETDTLNSYEVGAKTDLFDRSLSLDGALYYIDWQDVKQTIRVFGPNNVPFTAVLNSGSASGLGFEGSATVRPADGLDLGLTFSWNDLTVDQPVLTQGIILFDTGDRLNLSPEYTAGGFLDYAFPLGGNGLKGRFSASANYTSEQDKRTFVGGAMRLATGDSMLVTGLSFSVETANRWTATLYADNLNNEDGSVLKEPGAVIVPVWSARIRPRTVGVQFEYRYGH